MYGGTPFGSVAFASQLISTTPISDSDSAAATDAASLTILTSDTATGTESTSLTATLSGADTGTAANAGSVAASSSASDSASGGDAVSALGASASSSDAATGTESASLIATLSGTDAGTGADAGSVAANFSASDTASSSDAVSALAVNASSSDTATGTDRGVLTAVNTSDAVENTYGQRDYLTQVRIGNGFTTTYVDHLDSVRYLQQIVVPSYIYPTWYLSDPTSAWDRLQAQSPANGGITAIVEINPNSGPDTASNTDYVAQVALAKAAGLKVYGYVATTYTAKTEAAAKAEIDKYVAWYGVDGIFLDEVDNTLPSLTYYTDLCTYVRSQIVSGGTVLNFGTSCPVDFAAIADYVGTFEGTASSYQSRADVSWELASTNPSQIYHIVYGISGADELDLMVKLSRDRNVGSFYLTDDVLPNPFDTVPPDSLWLRENQAATLINARDVALATPDDAAGLADSVVIDVVKSVSDPVGLADAVVIDGQLSPSDTTGLADDATTTTAYDRTSSDPVGLEDAFVLDVFAVISDGAGVADSTGLVASYARIPADNAGVADVVVTAAVYARTVAADDVGMADTFAIVRDVSVRDGVGLADSGIIPHKDKQFTDSIGLAEAFTRVADYVRIPSDTEALPDTVHTKAVYIRSTSDTAGLIDTVAKDLSIVIHDGVGLHDTATEQATYLRTVSEGTLMSETRIVAAGYARTVAPDTVQITDAYRFAINLGILDTETLSDIAANIRIIGVSEAVTADDAATLSITLLRIHQFALTVNYDDHTAMMKIGARRG